jgi:hypothetical protein
VHAQPDVQTLSTAIRVPAHQALKPHIKDAALSAPIEKTMIRVFHNPKTNFTSANKHMALKMTDNELVAVVNTNDLEEAYRLTNHIDESWYYNRGVTCHNFKARSTSVGDFMEKDGTWYVVAMCGFEAVNG